ncbi:hypothetical protein LLEC1_03598 [Akanthomyces lecanii]|uniref:Uncharacterized protein n=1 Tax=Cordyceps confragosa TaxID=2714763 RepID=A0A179I2S3_CORDF|nr:hypothetical protein LLEC1_03598 [Akanthomyces lecanii]
MATAGSMTDEMLLLQAAMEGQWRDMHRLLSHGLVHLDCTHDFGWTPLHWLATQGYHECVKMLLPRVATVVADEDGATALQEAVLRNYTNTCLKASLVPRLRKDTSPVDPRNGWTALMYACDGDKVAIARHHGAVFDAQNKPGHMSPWLAAKEPQSGVVKLLLEHGATSDAVSRDGQTPLLLAAMTRHAENAELVMEHGANVSSRSRAITALAHAIVNGDEATFEMLLDINDIDLEWTILGGRGCS